jgi:hypothetical protein
MNKSLINDPQMEQQLNATTTAHVPSITPEEMAKYFSPDTRPKGWLSIEKHLPMMYATDMVQGYTLYKVKDKNGNEFGSAVSDHNVWYYMAKEAGITHWWNGE